MDLREFIKENIKSRRVSDVLDGVENSEFYPDGIDNADLIKRVLELSGTDKQKIYSQLQSGGISESSQSVDIVEKKLSFCTDFPVIANNILALIGYDFAKSVAAIVSLHNKLVQLINDIPTLTSYEDCMTYITYIKNILSFQDSRGVYIFKVSDDFDISKFSRLSSEFMTASTLSIRSYIGKIGFLDSILEKIKSVLQHKNIALINKDKQNWFNVLTALLKEITIEDTCVIDDISDFSLLLNDFDVGYRGSFILQFYLLYKENYTQIPPELLVKNREYIWSHMPHIDYLDSIKFNGYNNYIVSYIKYFMKIFKSCVESCEKLISESNAKCINLEITDRTYSQLSQIVLNLYVQIIKHIIKKQFLQTHFGRSNRVQFIQLIEGLIMSCQPRSENFTESQVEAIHYFLLSNKLLKSGYATIMKSMDE